MASLSQEKGCKPTHNIMMVTGMKPGWYSEGVRMEMCLLSSSKDTNSLGAPFGCSSALLLTVDMFVT